MDWLQNPLQSIVFLVLQNIALSPAELGDLIDIISGAPAKMIYHDPNKGRTG